MRFGLLLLLTSIGLVMTGCRNTAPKPPPLASARTAAKEQPSAVTPLSDARRYSTAADVKGAEARVQLSDTRASIEVYRGRVLSLTETVRNLQRQGSAATADLNRLYTEVSEQETYIDGLLNRVSTIQSTLGEERLLREQADAKLNETQTKLVSKEQEAQHLRTQLADAETDIAKAVLNAQANFKQAQEAAASADKIRGEKAQLLRFTVIVCVLFLISLVVNFIQFRSARVV